MLGRATIYVTHDQEEALSLADRIVVMKDGLVRQIGAPEELYAQPAHLRRRALHGLPQRARRCRSRGDGGEVSRVGPGCGSKAPPSQPVDAASGVVAIRPEDLSIARADRTRSPATVDIVEYGGATSLRRRAAADGTRCYRRAPTSAVAGRRRGRARPSRRERVLVYPARERGMERDRRQRLRARTRRA